MSERWLPVVGYEGAYEVSDQARVRSLDRAGSDGRRCAGRILKWQTVKGHAYVRLCNGRVKSFHVAAVALEAFVEARPVGMQALHRDDDPWNNTLGNLYWGTPTDNVADCIRNGKHPNANKDRCKRDHAFTPENIYRTKSGARQCRKCRKFLKNRWMEEHGRRQAA